MGAYANQLRKQAKSISIERMIKALGVEKVQAMMKEVEEKTPSRGTGASLNLEPLSLEEADILAECTKQTSWKAMEKILKLTQSKTGAKVQYQFAKLALRYLKNLK